MCVSVCVRPQLTLLGVLGRGTWGTVYKGQWRNLDVAVKTVRPC